MLFECTHIDWICKEEGYGYNAFGASATFRMYLVRLGLVTSLNLTLAVTSARRYNPMYNGHLKFHSWCNDQTRLLQSGWLLF